LRLASASAIRLARSALSDARRASKSGSPDAYKHGTQALEFTHEVLK